MLIPKETLIKAREFLSVESHWTKGVCWRDHLGNQLTTLPENTPSSCCAWGAVQYVDPTRCTEDAALEMLALAALELGIEAEQTTPLYRVIEINDEHTYEQVIEMFDKAIELCSTTN